MNLSLYLICHHGHWDDFRRDARFIQRVSLEKKIPITYFFSGIELRALLDNRDRIGRELWIDLVGGMQGVDFINPRFGYNNPHLSEIGGMTFNHVPLVQPWFHDQREYLEGILPEQIQRTLDIARYDFNKPIVTFHGPDGVYSPAVAYKLREHGLDAVIISSEFLGDDRRAKGFLYWASGLRHLVRTNDIQLQDKKFWRASDFIDATQTYGHQYDIPFVVVGCDIDEVNGTREMSIEDGVARLGCIGDEAYRRGMKIVNCNAASHWNSKHRNIEDIWPWDNVYAMQNGHGDLSWIIRDRNGEVGHVVWLIGERHKQGEDVRAAKEHLYLATDSACRHKNYGYNQFLTDLFNYNIGKARELLKG